MREYIPFEFWNKFHDHLSELNEKHREAIAQRNVRALCLSEREWKGFDVQGCWVGDTGSDPHEATSAAQPGPKRFKFTDPCNYLYRAVFRDIWLACTIAQHYDCALTGDYVEAF